MSKTGWNRKLGTSKKEQGIITPKSPRRKKCGCWYQDKKRIFMCNNDKAVQMMMASITASMKKEKENFYEKATPTSNATLVM